MEVSVKKSGGKKSRVSALFKGIASLVDGIASLGLFPARSRSIPFCEARRRYSAAMSKFSVAKCALSGHSNLPHIERYHALLALYSAVSDLKTLYRLYQFSRQGNELSGAALKIFERAESSLNKRLSKINKICGL